MTCQNNILNRYWYTVLLIVYFFIFGTIISRFYVYFINDIFVGYVFNILSWVLIVLLSIWFLFIYRRGKILKIVLLIFYIKWFWYTYFLGKFELRKDVVIVFLLLLAIGVVDNFRRAAVSVLLRWRYVILLLTILSFLPFLTLHVSHGEIFTERYLISGLWDIPGQVGYLFVVLMFIMPPNRIYLITIIYSLLIQV